METRIRNEMEVYLRRLDEAHDRALGDLTRQVTPEQKEQVRAAFLEVLEEILDMVKRGKGIHERFVQNVVLHSVDAIIGVDNDEKIFFWNRGAQITFEYDPDEVIGRRFETLIPEDLLAAGELDRLREETYRVGYVREFRTERRSRSGSRIPVSISRTLLRDEDDRALGYVAVIRDISEMLHFQNRIQQTEKLSLVGRLAAGIAHEVGSPLNVILGTAQMMLQGKESADPDTEELETIVSQIGRINRLIQQLLHYARPEEIRREEISLTEQVLAVATFLRGMIEAQSIDFQVDIPQEIPKIRGDRDQVQQVLINLIVNACDACSSPGARDIKRISIDAGAERDSVVLRISDSGSGIAPEHLPLIFEPFYTTKGVGRGTGLGLAVSRRIVEDHGGNIFVESVPGGGTTFAIVFPLSQER